jgi:hypothetical protein
MLEPDQTRGFLMNRTPTRAVRWLVIVAATVVAALIATGAAAFAATAIEY